MAGKWTLEDLVVDWPHYGLNWSYDNLNANIADVHQSAQLFPGLRFCDICQGQQIRYEISMLLTVDS